MFSSKLGSPSELDGARLSDPKNQPTLVTFQHLETRLGLSRMTIYRLLNNDETFPQPVRIGRAVRFESIEIELWLNHKRAGAK